MDNFETLQEQKSCQIISDADHIWIAKEKNNKRDSQIFDKKPVKL